MRSKCVLAVGTAMATLGLLPASVALAGSSAPVTVRVEGANRTLLPTTAIKTHAGSLTRFGAPRGDCSDETAAGALDAATRHRWKAIWESSFNDYEVTSILGETHTFASKKDYWEIFVNGVAAQTGACEIKVKPGEQLLFAAVPQKGAMEPALALIAPSRATVGRSFRVTVRTRQGRRLLAVARAQIAGEGVHATTDTQGVATITPTQRGALVLHATKPHYVRGLARVDVS